MARRASAVAAFLALAGALGVAGFWLLFTAFKTYDDEGYVLLSLANFARGGRLYTDIFTQYGPFFFLWNDALHRLLGFDFTNTAGRLLTLAHWLGAALLCAWLVAARVRSAAWALLALAATFAHLWQMTAEPMHPGGLIVFLVALAAWLGAGGIARGRLAPCFAAVGAIGAALALTKINVGAFLLAGAGAWLAVHAPGPLPRRATAWLAGLALAALPWALMRPLLAQPWVVAFAAIVSCAAVATLLATTRSTAARPRASAWLPFLGGGAATAALIAGLALARGTSLADLFDGVIRAPLRHPGVFFFPVTWRPGALPLALVSLAACIVLHARGTLAHPGFLRRVALARLALLAAAVLGWFAQLPVSGVGLTLSYGVSLAWLLVIPLTADDAARTQARVRGWLALLAILQALHAYPVGGSQIGWGTFLFAPLLVLAAAEAAALLRVRSAAPLAVAAAIGLAAAFSLTGWQRWRSSAPLRLPGAETLRLPELLSARLRCLALNASVHAGRLYSLPGIFSFNLWTGRPTPTLANTTHWFSLLTPARQQAIAAQLAADPQAAVVVERDVLRYLREGGIAVSGPLHDCLYRDFAPALITGNYELWTKRGRAIAPLSTARLYRREDADGRGFQLDVCLYVPPGAPIARLAWLDCTDEEHPAVRATLDAGNSRLEVTPLLASGAPAGATMPAIFPVVPPRLVRLSFLTHEPLVSLPRRFGVLRLLAPDGALVAEAVFAE